MTSSIAIALVLFGAVIVTSSHATTTDTYTIVDVSTTTQSATQTVTEIITQSVTQTVAGPITSTLTTSSSQSTCPPATTQVSSICGQTPPDVSVSYGTPTVGYEHLSFDGWSSTFLATEVIPLTVTSPTPVEVNLSAEDVPSGAWVHFSPAQVTASAGGSQANMTVSGIEEVQRPLFEQDNAGWREHLGTCPTSPRLCSCNR